MHVSLVIAEHSDIYDIYSNSLDARIFILKQQITYILSINNVSQFMGNRYLEICMGWLGGGS